MQLFEKKWKGYLKSGKLFENDDYEAWVNNTEDYDYGFTDKDTIDSQMEHNKSLVKKLISQAKNYKGDESMGLDIDFIVSELENLLNSEEFLFSLAGGRKPKNSRDILRNVAYLYGEKKRSPKDRKYTRYERGSDKYYLNDTHELDKLSVGFYEIFGSGGYVEDVVAGIDNKQKGITFDYTQPYEYLE